MAFHTACHVFLSNPNLYHNAFLRSLHNYCSRIKTDSAPSNCHSKKRVEACLLILHFSDTSSFLQKLHQFTLQSVFGSQTFCCKVHTFVPCSVASVFPLSTSVPFIMPKTPCKITCSPEELAHFTKVRKQLIRSHQD